MVLYRREQHFWVAPGASRALTQACKKRFWWFDVSESNIVQWPRESRGLSGSSGVTLGVTLGVGLAGSWIVKNVILIIL